MIFASGQDLLSLTKKYSLPIHEIMLRREMAESLQSKAEIEEKLRLALDVMRHSVTAPLQQSEKYRGQIIGGEARQLWSRLQQQSLCGEKMAGAIAYALAASEVNASMGKIVAAPTAGACGVLPALLFTLEKAENLPEKDLINGLLTAAALGIIYANKATISGAVGGCQAEVGVASSMAAAAAIEMMGGQPQMALDAASIAMANLLGLVCDPIAGLVESPCNTRNALGVANALLSADIVLAGIKAVVPFDETVEAMYRVGRNLPPSLKETSLGGIAVTPTAMAYKEKITAKNQLQ